MPGLPALIVAGVVVLLLGWGFHGLVRSTATRDWRLAWLQGRTAAIAHSPHQRRAHPGRRNPPEPVTSWRANRRSSRNRDAQRIGRDIHDDLGQNLLALKIDLSRLH